MLNAARLVGLLAEPERMRVVAALTLGASTKHDIASATGLEMRVVLDCLDRLVTGGLVEDLDDQYVLLQAAFKQAARQAAPADQPTAFPDEPSERQRILDQCLRDGRLIHMPSKRSRRLVLLEELAQRFEPGKHYSERQVNASLSEVDTDTATLRRYLVDNGFLDRGDGEYWRSGGRVR
jgi:hypothetical protein